LLTATNNINKIRNREGTLFIVGYSMGNVETIIRTDLPEKLRKTKVEKVISERVQAKAILPEHNNNIVLQKNNTDNAVLPTYPIVFVKRPATTDDVKHFIDSIRINDTTKCATCPELYEQFNNYCNRSELYTSIGNRQFSNFISKSYHYSISKDKHKRTIVLGISIGSCINVQRSDHIKFTTLNKSDAVGDIHHSNTNISINNNCKINNANVLSDPTNVLPTDKNCISNNNVSLTLQQGTNVLPTDKNCISNNNVSLTLQQGINVLPTDKNCISNNNVSLTLQQGINIVLTNVSKEFTESMIRDFWDAEMFQDANNRINIAAVNKSFQMWCEANNIHSNLKTNGLSRLLSSRLSLRREKSNGLSYIVGWNVRRNISKQEHEDKEDALKRIFDCWTDRYEIGRHNGPYPYYHIGTSPWRSVRVKHDYVYTLGTNGRIRLPGLESMVSIPGVDIDEGFILCLKADMGSGKSEVIKEYIEANPNMRIIYVVPVISLANKILSDLVGLGFKIYSDETINTGVVIEGNRICTTYNSVHKIVGNVDMIIFDEYRMIQKMQFSSILKTKLESYRAFCYRMRTTPRVIVADALLENNHVTQIKNITEREIVVYQCMNKFHMGKEVVVIDNEIHTINSIIADAAAGRRIAVASGGAKYARFIRDKIGEINPNINVGLYTKREMRDINVDVTTIWAERQHQVIIYTPTILAGSSYLGEIDRVYGIFLTNTVGPDGAVQMLFRCRKAEKFYVCVKDTHLRKKRMPDDIYPSYSNTLRWLDDRNRLYRTAKGEEDIILAGLVYGTGEIERNYQELYACYIQNEERARRNYLFYLLLYIRDMGITFGGLKSALTNEDKEAVKVTGEEYREYSKEVNDQYWEGVENAKVMTAEENEDIKKKVNKTEEEQHQMLKYKIMNRYGVPNEVVTARVARISVGKDLKHDNILACERLSGIEDDKIQEEMLKIYRENMPKHLKKLLPRMTERPMNELTSNIINGEIVIDSMDKEYSHQNEMEYIENMKCCFHAIILLRMFGLKDFMRLYTHNNNVVVESRLIIPYIDANWDEIRMITKLKKEKSDGYWNETAKILLDKAFGMSYICHKGLEDNPNVNSGVFTKVNGKVVLSAMDATKIPINKIQLTSEIFQQNTINRLILLKNMTNGVSNIEISQPKSLILNVISE
jgi:hypothetical protein